MCKKSYIIITVNDYRCDKRTDRIYGWKESEKEQVFSEPHRKGETASSVVRPTCKTERLALEVLTGVNR